MSKIKKYQLNRNVGFYNFDTGLYETRDGRNLTYEEALRNKWKCDKCFESFPNFRNLRNHKEEIHSYWWFCSYHPQPNDEMCAVSSWCRGNCKIVKGLGGLAICHGWKSLDLQTVKSCLLSGYVSSFRWNLQKRLSFKMVKTIASCHARSWLGFKWEYVLFTKFVDDSLIAI